MTNHLSKEQDVRVGWLLVLMALAFAAVISLAISFRPPDVFITDDWREAAKYARECFGHANTSQVWDETGLHYEITCKER